MVCECAALSGLTGDGAKQYASEHLVQEAVNEAEWTIEYRCPESGRLWVLDYPDAEYHGGGSPQLRPRQVET